MKKKISLKSPEDATDFINLCSKYDYDINIYDGHNVIDAKSIIAVFSIPQGKEILVEILADKKCIEEKFISEMRRFKV